MEVYKLRLKSHGSGMLKGRARPKDSVDDPPSRIKGKTPGHLSTLQSWGSVTLELLSDLLASLSWACSRAGMKGKGPVFIFSHLTMSQIQFQILPQQLSFNLTIILKSRSFKHPFDRQTTEGQRD